MITTIRRIDEKDNAIVIDGYQSLIKVQVKNKKVLRMAKKNLNEKVMIAFEKNRVVYIQPKWEKDIDDKHMSKMWEQTERSKSK